MYAERVRLRDSPLQGAGQGQGSTPERSRRFMADVLPLVHAVGVGPGGGDTRIPLASVRVRLF
ncbi:MAG: hypothetical protein CVT61_10885 [Actinobacteria bacterium HGW-Actinobacteria-11]|nr:MAG: hypothetical protein CVT61_10885 [Actinobacteria bacterium HGW-Actinobacteria-11]